MAAMTEVEYLIATAGRYDLMLEVLVDDDAALMALLSTIRSHPGVVELESFISLKLFKQTFSWGAR